MIRLISVLDGDDEVYDMAADICLPLVTWQSEKVSDCLDINNCRFLMAHNYSVFT